MSTIPSFLNLFDNLHPENAAERAYLEINKMLFNYELAPGQKLQYEDLANHLKVSRTPVKEALTKLEKDGFVVWVSNKGYYVAEISIEEANEIFDIRRALEPFAVRGAIANWKIGYEEELKKAMEFYERESEKSLTRRRLLADADFHTKIAAFSLNRTLTEILCNVFAKGILKYPENLPISRAKDAQSEHAAIYQALLSRDSSAAIKAITKHIEAARKIYIATHKNGNKIIY
jgi:DNA-binding GntR family transcriptional regulator